MMPPADDLPDPVEPTSLTTAELAMVGLLRQMPDPVAAEQSNRLEIELADRFGVAHAVTMSSGTAALHCALLAAGIGSDDEVLIPAVSVPMSAAPILYAGARPVFVDCSPDGGDLDYQDLTAKITSRTRAVLAVHLWGRSGALDQLCSIAAEHQLRVIEDACQAHGTRYDEKLLGTFGDAGCLSFKDGKILSCGEGGAILTDDEQIAATARALRTHWQTPPPGSRPGSQLGYNYRLGEPLALLARSNLTRFEELLAGRRRQTRMLTDALAGSPGLNVITPGAREGWNGYSPLFRIELPRPRAFAEHLAQAGVANSVGTFGLIPCHLRPPFAASGKSRCPNAEDFLNSILAIVLSERTRDTDISRLAGTIVREAAQWVNT